MCINTISRLGLYYTAGDDYALYCRSYLRIVIVSNELRIEGNDFVLADKWNPAPDVEFLRSISS